MFKESLPPADAIENAEPHEEGAGTEWRGLVDKIRQLINSKVQESKLPTQEGLGYESTLGIYGGKLAKDPEGKLVYDTRGLWSKIDQWGDRILQSFDEHHAREPLRMAWQHPAKFMKMLPFLADSKRYRGTPEQTMENVNRFGLGEYYAQHPWGIEVKQPEVFKRSIGLQDIFRSDTINSPILNKINRFEAEAAAVKYMRETHDKAGGIAEGNAYMFLFTELQDDKVSKPIFMIPTEVYNPDKKISDVEKKSTDLLDFLASIGMEEWRRSHELEEPSSRWASVEKALRIALDTYGDTKVIHMVASYVKRGRLTLPGDIEALDFDKSYLYEKSRKVFSAHNTQRLTAIPEISAELRRRIVGVCEDHLSREKSAGLEN